MDFRVNSNGFTLVPTCNAYTSLSFENALIIQGIIICIWILSIFLSSNVLFTGIFRPINVLDDFECYLRDPYFIVIGSVLSFVIPLLIMILMFVLMARKLRSQIARVSHQKSLTELELATTPNTFDKRQTLRRHMALSSKNRSLNINLKPAQRNSVCNSMSSITSLQYNADTTAIPNNKSSSMFYRMSMSIIKATSIKQRITHNEIQSEAKALQVLVIVFMTFVIAWLPYCLVNISSVIFSSKSNAIQFQIVLKWLTYLGYLSSTLNPIIYTAFNKKFRSNFLQIILCSRKKKRKHAACDFYENSSHRQRN
jgi:5-hydroxytryptamine receptor 2